MLEGLRTNRRSLKAQFHLLRLQYALHIIETFGSGGTKFNVAFYDHWSCCLQTHYHVW